MRFVKVEVLRDGTRGYALNADEYLRVLPELKDVLPPGAREFAVDPDHYNFFGPRCVKDLQMGRLVVSDAHDRLSVSLWLLPNTFKHERGLMIQYVDVVELAVDVSGSPRARHVWPETRRLGDVQLDEILPHEKGCSHELQMTGGSMRLVAADLVARWQEEASPL
ncbi:hypothetical protein [Micromonospora chersina]|uniref:hypothetical protein n=1 Tax=Micromonospora chersina TaxID=47854 RepID=UPI00340B1A00